MMDHLMTSDPRYRAYIDRAHRLRARAFRTETRRGVRAVTGVVRWAISFVLSRLRRAAERYGEWRRHEAAIGQLRGLSDSALKDIGLHRSQIRSAVLGLNQEDRRPIPAAPSQEVPAEAIPTRLAA